MEESKLIPLDYGKRLEDVLSTAWTIFKSHFVNERYFIDIEAPFQHHFANIISQVGNLYCLKREDIFLIDLETKCENIKGKNKSLDITCKFMNQIQCAIELKFKTGKQGAQDEGRMGIYVDIERLELACKEKYDIGKFYAITDSKPYINASTKGVGTVFATHDGHTTEANKEFWLDTKTAKNTKVFLSNSYTFHWEQIGKWYFLEITINHSNK